MAEPAQTAERRTVVEDSFARLPRLDIVYKTVPANTPDFYALDMLGDILFGGPSSRLYQKLVKEKAVALQVAGGIDFRRGPALFQAFALLKPGQDAGEVEKLIYEEFERVKTDGVTHRGNAESADSGPAAAGGVHDQHDEPRANAGPICRVFSRSGSDQHGSRKIQRSHARRYSARGPPISGRNAANRRFDKSKSARPAPLDRCEKEFDARRKYLDEETMRRNRKSGFRCEQRRHAILAAALPATGWSQGDSGHDKSIPTSKVERLNRAPVSKEILKVKLPRPIETTLPNGINLMILEDHRVPAGHRAI